MKLDIDGPKGNAFYIMGVAQQLAKTEGRSATAIEAILSDMRSSNYDHLLEVFKREFPYVEIVHGEEGREFL